MNPSERHAWVGDLLLALTASTIEGDRLAAQMTCHLPLVETRSALHLLAGLAAGFLISTADAYGTDPADILRRLFDGLARYP